MKEFARLSLSSMKSLIFRGTTNPDRIFNGASTLLIPGVNIDTYAPIGAIFKIPTSNIDGTINNSLSKAFSGNYEGYPSERDVEQNLQTRYSGFGLSYHYYSSSKKSFDNNEVLCPLDKDKIFAICVAGTAEVHNKNYLKFKDQIKEKYNMNLDILFYKNGLFFSSLNSNIPMSFDQNILTAESFKNPEIMEFMKNQYEVSIREDQKQKLDLKKARKEPVPTPKSSVEVTKIEESYSSLSRSDNDYGGNHYSG